ncbi:hypothetical protein BDB01DRAFT_31128 [Pilobolus umbonatus]|nr:hypothetical protein BDB01DRAFT_31128 [Pilobolus umbonatus]
MYGWNVHSHKSITQYSPLSLLLLFMDNKDCLFCRVTGTAVGLGAGYLSFNRALQIEKTVGRTNKAVGLGVAGVLFTSAGIYRLLFY